MYPDIDKKRYPGFIYGLPLLVTVFVSTVYLKLPEESRAAEYAFLHNPSRLIMLGAAYLFALMLVMQRAMEGLRIVFRNKLLVVLVCYMLASSFWSLYPLKVVIDWGHITGLTLVILCALFYIGGYPEKFFLLISGYCLAAGILSLVFVIFFPERGIYSINGRWMGVTTNPNSLGVICFVSFWANLACIRFYKQPSVRWFCALSLLIALILLVGTNSITSILCTVVVIACMQYVALIHRNPPVLIVIKLFLGMIVILSLLLTVIAIRPEWLSVDTILSGVGRGSHLTGRVELWKTGMDLILQKPWLGWGFDSLASVLSGNRMDTGQFHNGYVDLCIRGGFVGVGLFFALIAKLFFNCIGLGKDHTRIAAVYLILVLSILIHNLTEASWIRNSHLLWILFLSVYFHTDYLKHFSFYTQESDYGLLSSGDHSAASVAALSHRPF